jgi:signal transduction histidine kinase
MNKDSVKTKFLFDLSSEYYFLKDNKKSLKVSWDAYHNAQELQDSFSMGRALYYIGDCFEDFQKDSAYYYYKQSEKLFRLLKNDDRIAKVLYNKAYILFYEGNYVESEIEVFKALNCLKNTQNLVYEYRCYSLQGMNHLELNEYSKSLDYFEKAKGVLQRMNLKGFDERLYMEYYVSTAIQHSVTKEREGKFVEAIAELERLLTIENITSYTKQYTAILGNLAYLKLKVGDYLNSKRYFTESILLAKANTDSQGLLYKLLDFGEYHLETKDTVAAIRNFKEALDLSKSLNSGKEVLKALDFLSIADINNALHYKEEHIRVNDSIVKQQRENREKFTRIEYETHRIEGENRSLTQAKLSLLLAIALLVILFLILGILYYLRTKKKEIRLLELKNNADKELYDLLNDFQIEIATAKRREQERISKELHDGIMNQLYGVRMNLGILNNKDDEESKRKRTFYVKKIQEIETEVRNLSHDLHQESVLSSTDFPILLDTLVSFNNTNSTIQFELNVSELIDWDLYSSLIKVNLYRILQELIQNAIKHSEALNCTITFLSSDNQLTLQYTDNGIGFSDTSDDHGIGLQNINDRLKLINGKLSIESKAGAGTTIKILVR